MVWLARDSCVAAVILLLTVLSPPVALVRDPTPRFLEQYKSECYFYNGTQRVRLLVRYIYNREEYTRFDSDVGEFRAVTELGRAAVDTICRHNYEISDRFLVPRTVEPKVTVYPSKTQPLKHHNLLVCSVSDFYPGSVEVRWFRNGEEEKDGLVSTGLIPNGDWTFQLLVMLEMVPQGGEVYTCQVEHPSLTSPVRVEWSESFSAHTLYLLVLCCPVFLYGSQGQSGLQPTGNALQSSLRDISAFPTVWGMG
uniref:RT1 class II, locus Db1 n=1 Tax=Rattus norvegicus TaxID=10116 RepID=A0A8I6AEE1_RAT